MDKNEIFKKIQEILVETFEMKASDITMESHISEDLDLEYLQPCH